MKAALLPIDHPLFFLLTRPRLMRFRVGDGLWVRLVDVEAALSARKFAPAETIVLAVTDAFCPWNRKPPKYTDARQSALGRRPVR